MSKAVEDALFVMVKDSRIRAFLEQNDPMALAQAEAALDSTALQRALDALPGCPNCGGGETNCYYCGSMASRTMAITDKGRDAVRRAEAMENLFGPWPTMADVEPFNSAVVNAQIGRAVNRRLAAAAGAIQARVGDHSTHPTCSLCSGCLFNHLGAVETYNGQPTCDLPSPIHCGE